MLQLKAPPRGYDWQPRIALFGDMVTGRVAELGSLSSGEKMVMKFFVKRVFTIFTSNASILCVIANLQN